MGHIELRILPANMQWRRVTNSLGGDILDPKEVAFQTATAAKDRLLLLQGDPNLAYCIWLLVRLASAAQRPNFEESIARLGLDPRASSSVIGFLAQISARVRAELEDQPGSGPFGELAMHALARTLAETIGMQSTLLTSGLDDVERAFRSVSTPTALGSLVARFFGEFLARVLRFYVDRVLPLKVGTTTALSTIHQSELFVQDLDAYARIVASSVRTFAGEWFDLHHWQSDGAISRDTTTGFVAHSLDKMQFVLLREEVVA
jgi:hypothetical protein